IRKSGGRILLVPDIIMKYYVRSKFSEFIKHSFDNGVKVTYPFVLHKNILSWRHMVPLVFVSVLFMAAGMATFSGLHSPVKFAGLLTFGSIILIYLATSIYFSLKTVQKEKDLRLLFFMPFVFLSLHLSYGLGRIWGLVRSALRVVR
ncbi:MAG: hypothetical protein KKG95_04710, partial [Candidatus Omnitrophica bacterium]|nr:hypothetical protein [Candidatus Omnitrophota bacterium]